jgi:hypothetical protein
VCRSKAEGGQRCFGSAADTYQQALDRYETAAGGDLSDLSRSAQRLADAEVTLADVRGDHRAARRYRRALTRGAARRAANDAAARRATGAPPSDPTRWAEARGDRCRVCGQFIAATHRCPSLLTTPAPAPSTPDVAGAHRSRIAAGQIFDIELTGDAADAFEDRYGSTADPDAMLADALNELVDPFHDEVNSGGLEPWAQAAKANVVDQLLEHTRDVPDADLLTPALCAVLADPRAVFYETTKGRLAICDPTDPEWPHPTNADIDAEDEPLSPDRAREVARREALSGTVAEWAYGFSADSDSTAWHFQTAAQELLGNPTHTTLSEEQGQWHRLHLARARAVTTAQYALTQKFFAEAGITEVTVHRGMGWGEDVTHGGDSSRATPNWYDPASANPDDPAATYRREIPMNPVSSFTLDHRVAELFSRCNGDAEVSAVISGTVPVSRILSTPRTGIGCLAESEMIVLAGPGEWQVTNYPGATTDDDDG